jgi:hypothetical protein
MAGVRASRGDLDGACEAWAESVKIHRHVASLPQASGPHTLAALARAVRSLSDAFDNAGKREAAQANKAEARRIWSEIGLPEQD